MRTFSILLSCMFLIGCAGGNVETPVSPAAEGVVSINFDDGFESAFVNGMPIIDAAGLKTPKSWAWNPTYRAVKCLPCRRMVMKLPLTLAHIRICPLLRMRNSTTRLHRHEVPSRAEPPQETFERIVRKKVGRPRLTRVWPRPSGPAPRALFVVGFCSWASAVM